MDFFPVPEDFMMMNKILRSWFPLFPGPPVFAVPCEPFSSTHNSCSRTSLGNRPHRYRIVRQDIPTTSWCFVEGRGSQACTTRIQRSREWVGRLPLRGACSGMEIFSSVACFAPSNGLSGSTYCHRDRITLERFRER